MAPPLLLGTPTSREGQTIREDGTESRGSLTETAGLPIGRLKPLGRRSGGIMSREARSHHAQAAGQGSCRSLFRGTAFSLSLALFLSFSPALADKGGRSGIATDLQEKMAKESPILNVRLLLNVRDGDPKDVADRIQELGGAVRRHLRNVGVMVVDVPLGSVGAR